MRKIVVSEFVSLDGVMQAPGGADEDTEGGFVHGSWTMPYWHDDIGTHFFEAMGQSDTLLLGRKTWQIHGGAFDPMPAGDVFGDLMNTIPKYVVSTTLTSAAAWRNSTLIKHNVVEEVRALKAQPGKNIAIAVIDKCLKAAGAGPEHVVKVQVFMTDITERPKINPRRIAYFGDNLPASTLVEVKGLVDPRMKVEIECQAYVE